MLRLPLSFVILPSLVNKKIIITFTIVFCEYNYFTTKKYCETKFIKSCIVVTRRGMCGEYVICLSRTIQVGEARKSFSALAARVEYSLWRKYR